MSKRNKGIKKENQATEGAEINLNLENQEVDSNQQSNEGQLSSLGLLWKNAFQELDSWVERLNYHDEVFLNAARKYVERVNQNRENMNLITEQFNRELREWEGTAREELLMTTTSMQQFFPKKSYHEINEVMDDIQNKTTSIFITPIQAISKGETIDKYLETVEQYMALRKDSREQYINNVKQTANVLYENQKVFVNLFTKQLKTAIFPFQKYMEKSSELTNI
ncbi:hypothetical protein [Bacillus sp. 1NLA3E]|uniref:hypothetical protein n=1 Tax=Bacillus sp. 1NLA3E TaxID=666686 RepID=UPI000247EA38|nr:hypothetical protein [Bacillus sp. 1NLA3E]AGK52150.1 hypothetical protein B1NLA3E_01830 [Bacillus sp. 1NLA3E]